MLESLSNLFNSIPYPPLSTLALAFIAVFNVFLFIDLMSNSITDSGVKASSKTSPNAYLIHASVTHGRYIPIESKHAFTYPALYALVSLRALESGALNIGALGGGRSLWSWAFGYKNPKRRLTAINPTGYLSSGVKGESGTVLGRLEALLRRDAQEDPVEAEDAWMLTMPSFIGWEGINPLTVYFVYSRAGGEGVEQERVFSHLVLEIHNTFGESHVYVLKVGVGEDGEDCRGRGYDHQWTFPRQFHVSPFNDRSGFYSVAIKRPTHAPSSTADDDEPPKPTVRVQLYTDRLGEPPSPPSDSSFASSRGELKLSAILRPTASYPLMGPGVLLKSLVKMPFDLLLTMARIHYQAWILHYGKPRLDVYLRPEMKWARGWGEGTNDADGATGSSVGGGVRWLEEGLLERYARWRVESFLHRRVEEVDVAVTLVSANPAIEPKVFAPRHWCGKILEATTGGERGGAWAWLEQDAARKPNDPKDHSTTFGGGKHLRIGYLSSKLFTTLLFTPSAEHALLVGCDTERWFQVSSRHLFINVFTRSQPVVYSGTSESARALVDRRSLLQKLRAWPIPRGSGVGAVPIPVPPHHFLDGRASTKNLSLGSSVLERLRFFDALHIFVILTQYALDALERSVFGWARARVVTGQEPWLVWERAAGVYWGTGRGILEERDPIGSVREAEVSS